MKSSDKSKEISCNNNGNPTDKKPCTSSSGTFILNYLEKKIQDFRDAKFRVSDVKRYAKVARKKCGLSKAPKQKGYAKLITDEEKR